MRLSDIMGAADLAIYAEVGLVLFLLAFLGVVIRLYWPGNREEYDEALILPLSEEKMAKVRGADVALNAETGR